MSERTAWLVLLALVVLVVVLDASHMLPIVAVAWAALWTGLATVGVGAKGGAMRYEDGRRMHWREIAELDTTDPKLLGEDDCGDLWVPSRRRPAVWDRRFSPWRPTHWRYWVRSRRLRRIACLEPALVVTGGDVRRGGV